MARYTTTPRGKRSFTRRKSTKAPRRARAPARRRYTKKRSTVVSKRRILNTTSRKKRNGMLTWSNTTAAGASRPVAIGNAYVSANNVGVFVFSPTAMHLDNDSLLRNTAARTASTIYAKGISEKIRIQTSSGIPWFHRRVCFTIKGNTAFNTVQSGDTPTVSWAPYTDTTNGMERLMLNEDVNNMAITLGAQYALLFKGVQGVDWNDTIIAPLDTSRITVKFDKTWTYQSGNNNGIVRERKLWHGMNHNLVYDDDEAGEGMITSYFSVDSKAGMGDYYIVDFFQAGQGGVGSDLISINMNSTMYWHEK